MVECPEDHKTLWTEQTENGESKEFAGESMGGFYTTQMPVNVFSYMWCLINDDHEEPVVSDKSMKMKFNPQQPTSQWWHPHGNPGVSPDS